MENCRKEESNLQFNLALKYRACFRYKTNKHICTPKNKIKGSYLTQLDNAITLK